MFYRYFSAARALPTAAIRRSRSRASSLGRDAAVDFTTSLVVVRRKKWVCDGILHKHAVGFDISRDRDATFAAVSRDENTNQVDAENDEDGSSSEAKDLDGASLAVRPSTGVFAYFSPEEAAQPRSQAGAEARPQAVLNRLIGGFLTGRRKPGAEIYGSGKHETESDSVAYFDGKDVEPGLLGEQRVSDDPRDVGSEAEAEHDVVSKRSEEIVGLGKDWNFEKDGEDDRGAAELVRSAESFDDVDEEESFDEAHGGAEYDEFDKKSGRREATILHSPRTEAVSAVGRGRRVRRRRRKARDDGARAALFGYEDGENNDGDDCGGDEKENVDEKSSRDIGDVAHGEVGDSPGNSAPHPNFAESRLFVSERVEAVRIENAGRSESGGGDRNDENGPEFSVAGLGLGQAGHCQENQDAHGAGLRQERDFFLRGSIGDHPPERHAYRLHERHRSRDVADLRRGQSDAVVVSAAVSSPRAGSDRLKEVEAFQSQHGASSRLCAITDDASLLLFARKSRRRRHLHSSERAEVIVGCPKRKAR